MKTGSNTRGRKGVSTIIAAIFILATLLAFLLTFTFILQRMATTTSNVIRANQLLLKKQQERLTINSITITGTSVTITVTNDGTQPIILVNYIIRNNTVKIVGKITPEKYVAPQTRTTLTITTPYTLSPASTYEITLISELGNAFKATYPIPTTNATTLPGIQVSLANTYLPRIAGEGTVTWAGTATIPTPQTRAGNVYAYTALTGAATGSTTNLNYADNQNITATPVTSYIITRTKRTAILYDDFQSNPLTSGRLIDYYNTGTWGWDPGYQYVYQTSTSTSLTASGEIIALFNITIPTNGKIYTLQRVNSSLTSSSGGYYLDTIYLDNATGNLYTLGIYNGAGSSDDVEIYLWSSASGWTQLTSSSSTFAFTRNKWYWELGFFDFATGALNITVYDSSGVKLASAQTSGSIIPNMVGMGTYSASATFDDYVITVNATPLFVNFTGVPAGYNVSIYNATGRLVGSALADAAGFASVNVISQPIIRNGNITIYDTLGNKVASDIFSVIVGGDVYSVSQKFVSKIKVRTQVDLTGTISVDGSKVSSTGIGLALQSSLSTTNFTIYVYDWSLGTFVKVYNATGGARLNVTGLPASLVNQTNGTVVLELLAYDNSPFTLQVDCLNAFPDVWVPVSQDVLLVGEGGTSYIDVFKLSGVTLGSVALSYWETISIPGAVFNGSADIVYDGYVSYSLFLINGSGVYRLDLLNSSAPPVFVTDACRASLGGGVRAEVVHDPVSGRTYLVILPGVGNQSFCVYNLTAYPSGGAWLISFASRGLNVSSPYTVSAVVGTRVYTILQNTTSKAAVLVAVDPFTNSTFVPPSNTANFMPGLSNVGLAYDGKYLWLMLEGGSLYKVNPTYANFTNVPVLFLPAPIGYGDRMEYYNGVLILVRDSGSSEVWVIPTS